MTKETIFPHFIIFGDGASSGNPGPGGWGSILASPDGQVVELGGAQPETTNNRMELQAVISPLQWINGNPNFKASDDAVVIYTDSTYVIRGATQWCWGWKKRGWKTAEGKDVSNRDLWEVLIRNIAARKKIKWQYVRGHSGIPGNERVDEIAVAFSKRIDTHLFSGSVGRYNVSLLPLPEEVPLPEMKSKSTAPPVPASYLSLVNGELVKHKTWAECEARVKGRSGAKFKKVTTSTEEAEILRSWGVSGKV